MPLCEGANGDTRATPTHNPPTSPFDFTCPGGGPANEVEFGGGNGVTKITSPATVSDSGIVGYRTAATGLGLPLSSLRTSWWVRFTGASAGKYTYVCQVHNGMTGVITVGS